MVLVDLRKVLCNTNYGIPIEWEVISDNEKPFLLNEVRKLDPNLDLDGLKMLEKKRFSAKISAPSTSGYETDSFVIVNFLTERNLHNTAYSLRSMVK